LCLGGLTVGAARLTRKGFSYRKRQADDGSLKTE